MSEAIQIDFLSRLLKEIYKNRKPNFAGVGIVLYEDFTPIPTAPLKKDSKLTPGIFDFNEILIFLSIISNRLNEYHDGFHFISSGLELTHICQYFSPPIVTDIDLNFRYGGRYRAGLYGSMLDSVIACGVASNNYEPTIFVKGKVINLHIDEK